MCDKACIDFGKAALKSEDIKGKSVLEVGALDVNGSLRPAIEALGPASYIGVDIVMGRGVDRVCRAEDLASTFGKESFDVVVCSELLEHVLDWKMAVHNMKAVLRRGGVMLITTRSRGFPCHDFPHDHWRYETDDIKEIFGDLEISVLKKDPMMPGVLFLGRKPAGFVEKEPARHRLYSMSLRCRVPIFIEAICAPLYALARTVVNIIRKISRREDRGGGRNLQ